MHFAYFSVNKTMLVSGMISMYFQSISRKHIHCWLGTPSFMSVLFGFLFFLRLNESSTDDAFYLFDTLKIPSAIEFPGNLIFIRIYKTSCCYHAIVNTDASSEC